MFSGPLASKTHLLSCKGQEEMHQLSLTEYSICTCYITEQGPAAELPQSLESLPALLFSSVSFAWSSLCAVRISAETLEHRAIVVVKFAVPRNKVSSADPGFLP